MANINFSKPAALKSWVWLYILPPRARDQWHSGPGQAPDKPVTDSVLHFGGVLRSMGMAVEAPRGGMRLRLTGGRDAEQIDNAVQQLQSTYQPGLIMGILSDKDSAVYNCMKQVCDVRRGIRNINIQARGLFDGQAQYCANVGLKFNLKLGGANQALNRSDLGFFGDGKTMLVGIDVTHPSPGSASSAPSVAGIVASVDGQLAQWPAEIKIQGAREEMVADLEGLLKGRLRHWLTCNKRLPDNIVVYRDGVSEGQYDKVIDTELPLLKAACKATYPGPDTQKGLPRMAIVVVGKRHNTRFYPTSNETADQKSASPLPGTVVDRGISEARHWDFFLQAHAALQGTARPAHYFTVWDEIFYPTHPAGSGGPNAADVLQSITHNLCYLFGRATKAVSVCPPAYYADLVCTRARCYLSDLFDPSADSMPSGSVAGTEGGGTAIDSKQVEIHPNVRNTMFYI